MRGERSTPRTFPHPYPAVFDALVAVLPAEGCTLKRADRVAGTIGATTAMSWRSWGEQLSIYVGAEDAMTTTVVIDSDLRFGFVIWGVHQRNFDRVLGALDRYLAYYYPRP